MDNFTSRFGALLLCAIVLLGMVFAVIIIGVNHDNKVNQDWMNFSAQHHCSVAPTQPSKLYTVWQCDGFQVQR